MNEQKTIYVVFKTHFDIGFTGLASEVIERYGSVMLSDVIKTCESTRQFDNDHRYVWTMAAWPLIQSIDPHIAGPELIARAEELIRDGQIVWHALPFTTHTEFCGLEEFIRGMYFSRVLSEKYGKWPVSAKMTDVPGHTWILPSLLFGAGIRFLHLGCNPGCTPPDVPRLFYWEGPDGNRVLTFYNKGYYGSSLIPPADWPFPVWLALMQTNDNIGPQGPEVIDEILNSVKEEQPDAKVVVGTMDDFYKALMQYLQEGIPVIRGDLSDTWIHGTGTYPDKVGELRMLRSKLGETEKALSLGLISGLFGEADGSAKKRKLDKAYELDLLFGEHTWGIDVKTTTGYNRRYGKTQFMDDRNLPAYKRMEQSWDEQRVRVDQSDELVDITSEDVMNTIAGHIDANGARFIVFNGLGWSRSTWVDLELYGKELGSRRLVDAISGELIEVASFSGRWKAYIKDLPAFGYRTLLLKDMMSIPDTAGTVTCDIKTGLIENRWYRIEADRFGGGIRSLIDKTSGKEWVDNKNGYLFGQYRYDIYGIDEITEFIRSYTYRFYDWLVNDLGRMSYPSQEHLVFLTGGYKLECEQDKASASLIMRRQIADKSVTEYGNAAEISIRITLYEDQPHIDLAFDLYDKQETPFIEAGHFIFPIQLPNCSISINKLGSVIDPEKDIVKNANHLMYCCENWVDVSDGKNGMAIIPLDTPLFSMGDQGIYQFRREYAKSDPTFFFNAFNNSWGTNFPQWMGGNYTFRYRIIPHIGDWTQGCIQKLAFEAVTNPLIGYSSTGIAGDNPLPLYQALAEEMEGMEMQAFKPAEKGDGFILRVRELMGESREIELNLYKAFSSISKCDLLERIEEEIGANTNRISFMTRPFEIHSFYLKL